MTKTAWFVLASLLTPIESLAADFSFFATLRAGRNASADWEQGVGSDVFASTSTASFRWAPGNQHWRSNNLPQNFRIGYDAATGSAYTSVWDSNNVASTVRFTSPTGPLTVPATWTLPASSFFVSASARSIATSVNLENLSLAPGVQILSGSLPANLGASQPGGGPGQLRSLASPLIFNTAASGGDWYIAGTVRFSGLTSNGTGAQGSQLQFMMNAIGTDNPEPATFALIGLGVAALWLRSKRAQLC
jgi:hypothetical protein